MGSVFYVVPLILLLLLFADIYNCGDVNLALGKQVSTDASYTDGQYAVDGDVSTHVGAANTPLTWLKLNLEASFVVQQIKLTPRQDDPSLFHNIKINLIRADGKTTYSLYAGDRTINPFVFKFNDNADRDGAAIARHIELTGSNLEFAEIEVFGKPAVSLQNIALSKPVSSNSNSVIARRAVDGLAHTIVGDSSNSFKWVRIDLLGLYRVRNMKLVPKQADPSAFHDIEIVLLGVDGQNLFSAVTGDKTDLSFNFKFCDDDDEYAAKAPLVRYIVIKNVVSHLEFAEFEAYGTQVLYITSRQPEGLIPSYGYYNGSVDGYFFGNGTSDLAVYCGNTLAQVLAVTPTRIVFTFSSGVGTNIKLYVKMNGVTTNELTYDYEVVEPVLYGQNVIPFRDNVPIPSLTNQVVAPYGNVLLHGTNLAVDTSDNFCESFWFANLTVCRTDDYILPYVSVVVTVAEQTSNAVLATISTDRQYPQEHTAQKIRFQMLYLSDAVIETVRVTLTIIHRGLRAPYIYTNSKYVQQLLEFTDGGLEYLVHMTEQGLGVAADLSKHAYMPCVTNSTGGTRCSLEPLINEAHKYFNVTIPAAVTAINMLKTHVLEGDKDQILRTTDHLVHLDLAADSLFNVSYYLIGNLSYIEYIDFISPAFEGSMLSVFGSNFRSPTVVFLNNIRISNTIFVRNSSVIEFSLPASNKAPDEFHTLRVGSSANFYFRYLVPFIDAMTPNPVPSCGAVVTVYGENFGPKLIAVLVPANVEVPILYTSFNQLIIRIPAGTGSPSLGVGYANMYSRLFQYFYNNAVPTIQKVVNPMGFIEENVSFLIQGSNFGYNLEATQVFIGYTTATTSITPYCSGGAVRNAIVCVIPSTQLRLRESYVFGQLMVRISVMGLNSAIAYISEVPDFFSFAELQQHEIITTMMAIGDNAALYFKSQLNVSTLMFSSMYSPLDDIKANQMATTLDILVNGPLFNQINKGISNFNWLNSLIPSNSIMPQPSICKTGGSCDLLPFLLASEQLFYYNASNFRIKVSQLVTILRSSNGDRAVSLARELVENLISSDLIINLYAAMVGPMLSINLVPVVTSLNPNTDVNIDATATIAGFNFWRPQNPRGTLYTSVMISNSVNSSISATSETAITFKFPRVGLSFRWNATLNVVTPSGVSSTLYFTYVCPPGTFISGQNCNPCPINYFQPNKGRPNCIQCPAGKFAPAGSTSC